MIDHVKAIVMTIVPPTSAGYTFWIVFMQRATTFLGFLTALVGFGISICSLIWWIRRLRKKL